MIFKICRKCANIILNYSVYEVIDIMNLGLILAIIVGIAIGPFISTYGDCISKKIAMRDEEDNRKAVQRGEEPMILPEGMKLYKNFAATTVIICILNAVLWFGICLIEQLSADLIIFGLASSTLLALSIVDFQVFEIPIECNAIILFLGIVHTIIDYKEWLQYVIGFAVVSLLFLIISVITKGKGMGGGDIKLMATLGLLLGWEKILLVMILGSILGSVIHGVRMLVEKKENTLAFGPYLAVGAYIAISCGDYLISKYLMLFPNIY